MYTEIMYLLLSLQWYTLSICAVFLKKIQKKTQNGDNRKRRVIQLIYRWKISNGRVFYIKCVQSASSEN